MTPEQRAARNEANRAYREKNREAINEKNRTRYASTSVEQREISKARYENDKEKYSEINRRSYLKHKDKREAKRREWKIENPEKLMLGRARKRAQEKGLPFDLTVEDIVIPEFCPALGIKLTHQNGSGSFPLPSSASIDRIICGLGYVRGNIVIVSNMANMIKSNATISQLKAVADFYTQMTGNFDKD